MKSLVVVLLCVVGVALAKDTWKTTCKGKWDITSISATSPVKKGVGFTLTFSGNLEHEVTGGQTVYTTYYSGINLGTTTQPLKEAGELYNPPGPLPWHAGALSWQSSLSVPSNAPSGGYVQDMKATDHNGEVLFCIKGEFAVS